MNIFHFIFNLSASLTELRKYVNFKSITPISVVSKAALARSVLAELPQQVVSWMTLNAKKVNDSADCANNEISQD